MATDCRRVRTGQQGQGLEQVERRDLPGNDASWYRALLSEDNPDLEPLATVHSVVPAVEDTDVAPEPDTEPETEETAVDEQPADLLTEPAEPTEVAAPVHFPAEEEGEDEPDGEAEADDQPAEGTMFPVPTPGSDDDTIDNTSEMVGQLWTAQEPSTPFDDWEPDDMDRKIESGRPFRWTSVVAALAVIGLIVVGLVLLPSITRSRANDHREMMSTALWGLRTELPDTQASLRTATEPDSSVTALNDLSTQLTVLAAKSSAVDEAGRAELPSAPPFTSSAPIDELAPIQQRLEPLATTAQTIQRRISNLVEYRSLISRFMVLPELPTEADPATQADLRVVLASTQAESASILGELPSDVSLSTHLELAREINDLFGSWQIEYLEALRIQDPVAAEALIADLTTRLDDLDTALITPLAQIRRQTDRDLIDLADAVDNVLALTNGDGASS